MPAVLDRRLALFGILATSVNSACAEDTDFNLTIARKYKSDVCTSGYFAVNGEIIAYALEKPWQGNQTDMSSIPEGSYGGFLRYDKPDKWRIQLTGVPGRVGVQIHIGNTPANSTGCIIIGLKLGDDLCSVIDSAKAYDALKKAFYGSANPVATPNKNITVTVES